MIAPLSLALVRLAENRFVWLKIAPVKTDCSRLIFMRFELLKFAPVRSELDKFILEKSLFVKSWNLSCAPGPM